MNYFISLLNSITHSSPVSKAHNLNMLISDRSINWILNEYVLISMDKSKSKDSCFALNKHQSDHVMLTLDKQAELSR